MKPAPVLALLGPTAAGKTALAIGVAEAIGAEVVSIDSALVYRGMDIGTDKPTPSERQRVPHHMIDIIDPDRSLSVAEFRDLARKAIAGILERGNIPLLVGGSGLYFRAVVDPLEFPATDPELRSSIEFEASREGSEQMYRRLMDLDPEAAGRIQHNNLRRIVRALEVIALTGQKFSAFHSVWEEYRSIYSLSAAALSWPREEIDRRINERVDSQVARGLVAEVEGLVDRGFRNSLTSVQALGYAQVLKVIDGEMTFDLAVDEIKRRSRRFARRQLSWFGADPRVVWFDADPEGGAKFLVERSKEER